MIMTGQKRRSLTWVGGTVLLALAVLLLPFLPVHGQQPPAKNEASGTIVFELDGPLELLLGAERSPDQEAIELLKRALKILAEKKARPSPAAKPTDPEEVKMARAQVEALNLQLANQRRELQRTEAQLHEAQARLARIQGGPAIGMPLQFQLKLEPEKGLVIDRAMMLVPANKAQPDDLKSRLERLLREVEQLRRDIGLERLVREVEQLRRDIGLERRLREVEQLRRDIGLERCRSRN